MVGERRGSAASCGAPKPGRRDPRSGCYRPEPHEGPDSLEGLAFQLILQKLVGLERAIQGIPPLLQKIVTHLEAQTQQSEVPVATYAQLYPELQDEREEHDGEAHHSWCPSHRLAVIVPPADRFCNCDRPTFRDFRCRVSFQHPTSSFRSALHG